MKKIATLLIIVVAIAYAMKQNGEAETTAASSATAYELARRTTATYPEQILTRTGYTASYNSDTRCPNWVAWALTDDHTDGEFTRKGYDFTEDQDVPTPRATKQDIKEGVCGYQRGHMCPAQDNKWGHQAQRDAFLMTNICPQNGDLNMNDWETLESKCRTWARTYGTVYICCGPIFTTMPRATVGANAVAVPDAFFKVVLRVDQSLPSNTRAIGFVYDNKAGRNKMASYAHSVDYVESLTGIDFFYLLDDETEQRVEAECDINAWR